MNKEKREAIINKVKEYFSSNDIPADVVETVEETQEVETTEVVEELSKEEEPVEEKFEEVLLVDGETTVTVEPAVEVGAAIVIPAEDGTPVAAPAGEYELQDGRLVVVEEDGIIAAVNMPSEAMPEEDMGDDKPNNAEKVKRVIERIEKETQFLKEENEALKAELVELKQFTKEVFDTLLEEPSKEPTQKSETGIKQFRADFGGSGDPLEKWLNKHN